MNAPLHPPPRAPLAAAAMLARLPGLGGQRFTVAMQHGSMTLELYAPRGSDPQQPHTRDELYVVVQGHGTFDNGGEVHPFGPGDAIFVPAHRPHRFVQFSDDLACWVVFYGPEGGEATT